MEATAGILRGHAESWRGGAVRRVLGRLTAHLGRFGETRESAFAAQDRWQDRIWSEPSRPAARAAPGWMQQAELWAEAPAEAQAPAAPAPAPSLSRLALLARPVPVAKARTVRPRNDTSYAQRRRAVRTEDIARYLQVNQAVHGIEGEAPFALPGRSFAAEVSLWKGRDVGTPFLTGC